MRCHPYGNGEDAVVREMASEDGEERGFYHGRSEPEHMLLSRGDGGMK